MEKKEKGRERGKGKGETRGEKNKEKGRGSVGGDDRVRLPAVFVLFSKTQGFI